MVKTPTSTSESKDSTAQTTDCDTVADAESLHPLFPASEFVPLLTDLPALDELLRRHRVPRRGLVHFDVASTINCFSLAKGVASHALERGEKVVCIAVDPDADSTGQEGKDEGTAFRFYLARDLSELNARLSALLQEAQTPHLIIVHNFERLFQADSLQLAEAPFPIQGFVPMEGQAPTEELVTTDHRARVSRTALCQWLAIYGTVFRTLSSSLWLVASVGTPSLADSPARANLKSVCHTGKGAKDKAFQARTADSLSFRSLLDVYCDYSLRWGALTQRFNRKTGQKTEEYLLSLHSFSLPLGETLVAETDQDGQMGAKEEPFEVEEPRDRGFRA